MYRIMLVDDEQIFLDEIDELLSLYSVDKNIEISIKKYTDSSKLSIDDLVENNIFILDIEMKDDNGIDLATMIRDVNKQSIIMFISGHPDFKDDAFRIKANAFIDKPIDKMRFYKNMDAILAESDLVSSKIEVRKYGEKVLLNINDIIYVIPSTLCAKIITEHEEYDYENSFIAAANNLLDYYFLVKISGKCIINLNYIYENKKNSVILKKNSLKFELKKSVRCSPSFNKEYLKYQEKAYDRQI